MRINLLLHMGICCLLLLQHPAAAQSKTEAEHITKIVGSLQQKDSTMYANIFLPADSLAMITLRKAPPTSLVYEKARLILSTPELFIYQDSLMDKQWYALFNTLVAKGEKEGIHWHDCVLSHYELEALGKTRDEVMENIVQERFVGFVFVQDMLTRQQYGFTVNDLMKIEGKWYGGEVDHLYPVSTKDELKTALREEQIRILKGTNNDTSVQLTDSVAKAQAEEEEEEDEDVNKRKQVADRKLYTGTLDNEIPIVLYIRYIKGDCPEGICSWEAIFKFGDQDGYTKEVVTRGEDGKWIFTEEETGGVMELSLNGQSFTGVFTATSDKVDYEAKLQETPMSQKRLESLDAIIEKDMTR